MLLGLLIFNNYIRDSWKSLNLLKSSIGMYTDDSIIYFSDSSAEIIKQVLENDLNNKMDAVCY